MINEDNLLNIVYVITTDENDMEAKYVCPQCSGIIEHQTFDRKSDNAVYAWNCGSCYNDFDVDDLHLRLKQIRNLRDGK